MDTGSRSKDAPTLLRVTVDGVSFLTDDDLREQHGIVVAFSERAGGVSVAPYDSLNLASHVGDDPRGVDENRATLLNALRIGEMLPQLTMAEQVHGNTVTTVGAELAGSGGRVLGESAPIPSTDALMTAESGVPLLLCYADCVPVVLVSRAGRRAVSVVHAGWRGALANLPGEAAAALVEQGGCTARDLVAYIGPHIGPCCYEVDDERTSQFRSRFVTIAAVGNELDLAAAVRESLERAGVPPGSILEAGLCTSDHPERFYSFRAAQVTGRHGAIAAIV